MKIKKHNDKSHHVVVDARYKEVVDRYSYNLSGLSNGQLVGCLVKIYEVENFDVQEFLKRTEKPQMKLHITITDKTKKLVDRYAKKLGLPKGRFVGFLLEQLENGKIDDNDIHQQIKREWINL